MKYVEIKDEVVEILASINGRFISAYQVCQHLQRDHPDVWDSLVTAYPSTDATKPMGQGVGMYYSPATFVAQALANFAKNGSVPGLRHEVFSCEGVEFAGVTPGYTGNAVGIFAIQNS